MNSRTNTAYYMARNRKPGQRNKQEKKIARTESKYANDFPLIMFFTLSALFMEVILKIVNAKKLNTQITFSTVLYILLFGISYGIAAYLVTRIFVKRSVRYTVAVVITLLQEVLFGFQCIICQTFGYYYGLNMVADNAEGVATGFADTTIKIIFSSFFTIILLTLPLIALITFNRRLVRTSKPRPFTRTLWFAVAVIMFIIPRMMVTSFARGENVTTDKELYTTAYDITASTERFGLVTGTRLELKYDIFGKPEVSMSDLAASGEVDSGMKQLPTLLDAAAASTEGNGIMRATDYGENAMDIDFNAMAANSSGTVKELSEYFATLTPSSKNKYTGFFKGKNLIFLTCEAFSPYFISETETPTLYKMMNNGIVFENYYQPAWGCSTSDGEYSGVFGLVPEAGINSMKASKNNNNYFTLGNQFTRAGFFTRAYHNNSYTYYGRNETHENLGYEKFIGVDNGMEKYTTKRWPRSDYEMMAGITDENGAAIPGSMADYIDQEHFHIYYMTVSGHCMYSFAGNAMSKKNKDRVENLPYSDTVKSYFACNYELEDAMKYMLDTLEAKGILDDTVIVLNADHYPYGLDEGWEGNSADYFSEMVGHTIDTNFERHKNRLIIYNSAIKDPIVVTDPVYSLDILPTLSNLFGFEFDSRLFAGRDIFSDAEPLVLFRNYSWITDKGMFNHSTGEFTPAEGVTVDDGYVKFISAIVKQKVQMSLNVLESDYYGKLYNAGYLK